MSRFRRHCPYINDKYWIVISSPASINCWALSTILYPLLEEPTLRREKMLFTVPIPHHIIVQRGDKKDFIKMMLKVLLKVHNFCEGKNFHYSLGKITYLYLALETQEWERNENVGKTARPLTLERFIAASWTWSAFVLKIPMARNISSSL